MEDLKFHLKEKEGRKRGREEVLHLLLAVPERLGF